MKSFGIPLSKYLTLLSCYFRVGQHRNVVLSFVSCWNRLRRAECKSERLDPVQTPAWYQFLRSSKTYKIIVDLETGQGIFNGSLRLNQIHLGCHGDGIQILDLSDTRYNRTSAELQIVLRIEDLGYPGAATRGIFELAASESFQISTPYP